MARQFSDARTCHFVTQLAATTRAGLSMGRTLKLLQENQGPTGFTQVWLDVEQAIARGVTFGQALKAQSPPIPPLCADLIVAGEMSGHLELVLQQLRRYYDMRASLRRAAIGASVYPILVALFGFSVWTLLRVLSAGDKLAAVGEMLTGLGLVLACLVAGVLFFQRSPPGRLLWHGFILYFPLVGGAIRRLALARFARTLAMMYTTGIRMDEALEQACIAASNVHVTADLRAGRERVQQGEALGEAFGGCRFVPAQMREMLHTGDLTGTYDETLQHVADIYEDEARQVLTNLPKVIAPVMLLGIGVLVIYLFYTYYLKPYVIDPVNALF